jgi:proteasome lid subunit RPN8/RPN11
MQATHAQSVPGGRCNVHLSARLRARLEAMVYSGYPDETCGLLLGVRTGNAAEVRELVQARNLNRERARDRYELDPDDFLAAYAQARRQGIEIVGIWHSHPDHPACPSLTDRTGAWAGWSYVIVSVGAEGVQELRSWRLNQKAKRGPIHFLRGRELEMACQKMYPAPIIRNPVVTGACCVKNGGFEASGARRIIV